MKRIIYGLLLFFSLSVPVWADFNSGVVAYLMGEYDKAFATMQSLSETADHGYAQYYLGMMYLKGQGARQDLRRSRQMAAVIGRKRHSTGAVQSRQTVYER
ncbi:MAG: hypothetical protein U5P41_09760 [Gammaproteobacteria bacterium]|nr:hypothetical protein [Gammaproteobacteria bacterium]